MERNIFYVVLGDKSEISHAIFNYHSIYSHWTHMSAISGSVSGNLDKTLPTYYFICVLWIASCLKWRKHYVCSFELEYYLSYCSIKHFTLKSILSNRNKKIVYKGVCRVILLLKINYSMNWNKVIVFKLWFYH